MLESVHVCECVFACFSLTHTYTYAYTGTVNLPCVCVYLCKCRHCSCSCCARSLPLSLSFPICRLPLYVCLCVYRSAALWQLQTSACRDVIVRSVHRLLPVCRQRDLFTRPANTRSPHSLPDFRFRCQCRHCCCCCCISHSVSLSEVQCKAKAKSGQSRLACPEQISA